MKTIKVKLKDKIYIEHMVDRNTDDCLMCGEPLRDQAFSWNMFHGEASASCCNAPYQTKDFYVDEDKQSAYAEYFDELSKPGMMSLWIRGDWIGPLKQAMSELGAYDVQDNAVYDRAAELVELASPTPESEGEEATNV